MTQNTLFSFPGKPRIGEVEQACSAGGEHILIGVDEVGRGPLAGPVVAAACVLDPEQPIPGLDDSKRLTEAKREALFPIIQERALAFAIAGADHTVIDRINILQATFQAMIEAIEETDAKLTARGLSADVLLVDGKQRVPLVRKQRCIIKGDRRSFNIAAASVLAKVFRDRLMVEMDARYPGYGLAGHKGYPTPTHKAAIARLGPSPIHRRSFRGVKEHVSNT